MKFVPTYTIEDSEVFDIVREMGYGEAIEDVEEITANLFWDGEFMNDCFKRLRIDDHAVEEEFITLARYLNPDLYDEEEEKEARARAYIIKALNKYAKENGIEPDYILVDVSW